MNLPILPTTSVGSFPKPKYLLEARSRFAKDGLKRSELVELEKRATQEWIEAQEEIGLDILVDGEMYRGDMATYFAENLRGTKISGLVRSYGNRYYKKPIVIGQIARPKPITVAWWQFAQSLTEKPVKGMLTGPYTMMDWSFNEHYKNRRDVALAFAEVIRREAEDLQRAGANFIQIDEPAVSVRPEEVPVAIEAMGIATQNLRVKTITHICYGDFEKIYPEMLKIPVDQFDLEMANSGLDMLELFKKHPFTKEIAFGVVDVHSHKIETEEEVFARIERALTVFRPEQMTIDPDCGLKTRSVEEARNKLQVMVRATKRMREKLAGAASKSYAH